MLITTEYKSATDTKPSRIRAVADDMDKTSVYINYDDEINARTNHINAAKALLALIDKKLAELNINVRSKSFTFAEHAKGYYFISDNNFNTVEM